MRPYRKVLRFFLIATVICIVLVWPRHGPRSIYGSIFRITISTLLNDFGDGGSVKVIAPEEKDLRNPRFHEDKFDSVAVLEVSRTHYEEEIIGGRKAKVPVTNKKISREAVDIARTGYVPTALVIALVIASPVTWKRRLWALVWGGLLVTAFAAGRFYLFAYYRFSRPGELQTIELGGFSDTVVSFLYEHLFVSPTGTVLVPVFVWLLVTFRRSDLDRLREIVTRATTPPTDSAKKSS